ncbi:related to salicylate hydroxylase [Phialocephala subalpina]|uniref:Related to salicylate hydroxylase n=1 Tax=Phialocephala subalpina TaxID=576137 RepID=A0A1L7WBZ1_9HELO|nr:related to salicylate hydroxylase [Phialocephala subalpina]
MKNLNVLVVGAGIGGLQAALALAADGHKVTVLETAKEFLEVGAGIRVPPNSSRLSLSWGVDFSNVKKEISLGNRFVDWKGNVLLDCSFDDVETKYGAPYYFLHRADLITLLVDAANKHKNINLMMGCTVDEYDFEAPAVKLSTGTRLSADLVICADGIKSAVRNIINGAPIEPQDTGDVAYRILVPAKPLLEDPTMRRYVTEPWAVHWMGPEAHAVGYPLRGGELYNIIIDITHATDVGRPVGQDEWRSQADNSELVKRFVDWCEPVRKICGLTGTYLKWRLADFDQLQRWVHPSGKVALLGDACHPMMPYMAQGAAQATEDAATLQAALRAYSNLPEALKAYERQRLPRAAYVAKNTRVLQEWLHLYDCPERNRRDELMRHDNKDNPMFWAYSGRRDWLFGHDAQKLLTEEELQIPDLPPMPADEARVYLGTIKDTDLRNRSKTLRPYL